MSNLRVPVSYTGGYTAADLITHLSKASTSLCACFYALSSIDGSVVAMTSFSSDLTGVPGYPGVTFKRNTGVSASQLQSEAGNTFGQMEASLFLLSAGISEADVLAGKWAHALGILFICNYDALDMGQIIMQYGYLAEFIQRSPLVTAEIKGINNALTAQVGQVTRAECKHDFCDSGCTLDVANYSIATRVDIVTSQSVFTDISSAGMPAEYFNNGKITFTDGANSGYSFRVDSWNTATGLFTLRTPTPYLPVNGDRFTAVGGCQKRLIDCQTRVQVDTTAVNNVLNFAGFPHMPTLESFVRLPAGSGI